MNNHLPKFWTKLFKWLCNDSLFEELQGDLEERFYINTKEKGLKKAKHQYKKEVIKMIRPSVLKSALPKSAFRLSIFKMHWTLSVRSLRKNKVFSLVTTLGFAAAISISLFLINLIYSGYSLDQQHNNIDRIYRIATKATVQGETNIFASTPFELKDKVAEEIPGFELLTHMNRTLSISFQRNDYPITLNGIYVDDNFFEIFNFSVISGNLSDIFKDRNSVIITEESAQKLFAGQNPIGQITNQGQIVRAVIESPKNKSHIKFEAIANITSLALPAEDWQYRDRNYLYGLISKNIDVEALDARLTRFSDDANKERQQAVVQSNFFLQPITGIMF